MGSIMKDYEHLRHRYRPEHIKFLLIAESPPPEAEVESSRQFYRSGPYRNDRLFINTIRALYPETVATPQGVLENGKEQWLRRFQRDGWYMIEALEVSQVHEVTKQQRQTRIKEALPRLIARVRELASADTHIILIKSNVFEVAAEPLRSAGFSVLNTELVDYPGQYNQSSYRRKLNMLRRLVN